MMNTPQLVHAPYKVHDLFDRQFRQDVCYIWYGTLHDGMPTTAVSSEGTAMELLVRQVL